MFKSMFKTALTGVKLLIITVECAVLVLWYARYYILLLGAVVWSILFFAGFVLTPGMAIIGALLLIPIGYYQFIATTDADMPKKQQKKGEKIT